MQQQFLTKYCCQHPRPVEAARACPSCLALQQNLQDPPLLKVDHSDPKLVVIRDLIPDQPVETSFV